MLKELLKNKIKQQNSISISEYMETCLYHTKYGYYMTRDPFGKDGDFTTAPEITQLYGEILALWVVATWQKLGSPASFNFIECGAGRGTLMRDMLRTLKKIAYECFNSAEVKLVEISPFLQNIQEQTLNKYNKIIWHKNIQQIDLSKPTILIANELLDAFPVNQFIKNNDGTLTEKRITIKNDKFCFTCDDEDCNIIEKSPIMDEFLSHINKNIKQGAVLFIDYGFTDDGKDTETSGDTLQAIKNHKFVDVLTHCGNADITTHVNFSYVAKLLGDENISIVPMATFLIALGLPVRAITLIEKQPAKKEEIEQAVYRLLNANEMGGLFKVLTKIYL